MQTTATQPIIRQFKKPGEGCLGYVIADPESRKAAVIDPRHDQVDEYLAFLREQKLVLTHVIDTHTHADHLSGAAALKKATGVRYAMLKGTLVKAADMAVSEKDVISLGSVELHVIESPGHTPDSITLRVDDNLFTGDTLLIGGSGRTDFMGGDAGALFDSFAKFAALDDDTVVWPGHDYQGRTHSTLGAERRNNVVFLAGSREAAVKKLAVHGPLPANMAEILTFNRKGEAPGVHIDVATASDLRRQDVTFVDVRSALEFSGENIEGSWNIPLPELEDRLGELRDAKKPVIVLCRTGNRSLMAAQVLERRGFKDYRVLDGGITGWAKQGLPVKRGKKRISIERQVQMAAGSLMLTGVILGTLLSPWFYALSAFVGAGLTFAGLTGFCGMGMLLLRMPWNQIGPSTGGGTSGSCSVGGAATGSCSSGGGCAVGG
ncbi:MAG: hypothetical protein DPW14_09260 [Planctomycetes bacterium]|nr:hypothetical protein [Planctomycetota bacterium]